MKTLVLVIVLGVVVAIPAVLSSGTAEAQNRRPQVPDRCSELRPYLEEVLIDGAPVTLKERMERIILALKCTPQASLDTQFRVPLLPSPDVPPTDMCLRQRGC